MGDSPYVDLRMSGTVTVADALTQLYVLMPVLDDGKHYWVADDEIDKLLRAGGAWLAGHPERELITRRYLRHQRPLVDSAVARLAELDDEPEAATEAVERAVAGAPLHKIYEAVFAVLALESEPVDPRL